jgi:hypothetical protein
MRRTRARDVRSSRIFPLAARLGARLAPTTVSACVTDVTVPGASRAITASQILERRI